MAQDIVVSVVILNYNGREHLETCLSSLRELEFPKEQLEVLVIDNASTDGSVGFIKSAFPEIQIIENEINFGFSKAANIGASNARGKYVAFLNNDMRVDSEWLTILVDTARAGKGFACVGSTVLNWDGTEVDFSGRIDDAFCLAYSPSHNSALPVSAFDSQPYLFFVSGGAALFERQVFQEVGGFDPDFFLYHEDVDLGWRLWLRGYECVLAPKSVVYHKGGASSNKLPRDYIQGLSQKHTLFSVFKNLENNNLKAILPLVLYVFLERNRWVPAARESLPTAIHEFQCSLDSLIAKRNELQRTRVRSDASIFALLSHPFNFVLRLQSSEAVRKQLLDYSAGIAFDPSDADSVRAAINEWLNIAHFLYESRVIEELVESRDESRLAANEIESLRGRLEESENGLRARDEATREAIRARDEATREAIRARDEATREAIRARDAAIRARDEAIRAREDAIRARDDELIRERDQVIRERDQVIQERDQVIHQRDQVIHQRDQVILERDQVIHERDEANRERNEAICERDETIRQRDEAILLLQAQLADSATETSSLSARLSAKAEELDKITRSAGWRMLNRYGRFKYRYLLPAYRLFGRPTYDRRPKNDNHVAELQPAPPMQKEELPLESNACDVVCFPIIDWDFRFQRPQQLMSRFADADHRVFYINQQFRSSGPAYTIQEKRENIYEVSLRGPERNVYTGILDDEARDLLFASLDELRRDLLLGATVAFVQLPFWWPLVNQARDHFAWPIVYDCMDHHAGFSTNKQIMLDQERDLLESADLVVVSSSFLEEQARRHNPEALLLRNACDYEHFAKVGKPRNKRPLIGYYGAIADWFDSDLVADLAERQPDWDFVLVGSTFSADVSRISKLPNVSLPGEKSYSEIPDWLSRFDVAIIPFRRTPLTEATNPVKVYEILAAGKPLVSVPIPEVVSLAPLVRLASTPEEFEKEIAAALSENDPNLAEQRRAFAHEHTWEKRYETLAPTIRGVFPKASIIVVTFNNLKLNRLCLESIYARTEWPNFEVIVVDNNSTDGTPEYLKEAETAFPNLRVILNESNLGFAAANNIGLRRATGDCLVLLNNDTVVTRGWISALIRHLHCDATIGLIGPVTNTIGNEAKVEVDYTQLEDMPAWAARFVRDHDGRVFSIPMLAMFCVAMRKEVFESVGFLDEQFGIGMFEDDDYAHRIKVSGLRLVCAADSFVHHFGQAAFKKLIANGQYDSLFAENRRRYEQKWNMEWVPHQYAPLGFEPTAAIVARQPEGYPGDEG